MRKQRTRTKLIALLAGVSLVAAACGDDDDDGVEEDPTEEDVEEQPDEDEPDDDVVDEDPTEEDAEEVDGVEGGTLVWVHEQEPPDLHVNDPANNLTIARWIRSALLEGLHGHTADLDFYPQLLESDGEVTENDDGTFTYEFTLRDDLMWSDGEPLTSADVEFTYLATTATDDEGEFIYLLGDHSQLEWITDFEVTSDTEFTITSDEFYAGWSDVDTFTQLYPAHVFSDDPVTAAEELNESLPSWETPDGGVIPSSGPMVFVEWNQGVSMTLERNDNYHGSNSPDAVNDGISNVERVEINFVADTDTQINALRAAEAHVVSAQPQTEFEQLVDDPNVGIEVNPGPIFEHWGFNLNNVHLAKPEVREALALAMDKGDVMADLYTPLFGDTLPAEGLGNTYWMSNQDAYEDHAGEAGYGQGDVEGAQERLEAAGYELNANGIYEHPDDGELSLRVGTTGGNRLRELQQQSLQEAFGLAGIEIEIDNVPGADYFSEHPFHPDSVECANTGGESGNCELWDITQFAWVGGPWPGGMTDSYRTGSGNNAYGYSNDDFDALADQCEATVDDDERADCYNELNRYVTTLELDPDGLFMLPLTQKPTFYAYDTTTVAQVPSWADTNNEGPISMVGDYTLTG